MKIEPKVEAGRIHQGYEAAVTGEEKPGAMVRMLRAIR
jgi:hypothetical protein